MVSVVPHLSRISNSLPGEASESGIIFQPAEVEDVVIETVDETKGEGESDMPYSKPQFPALTPPLSCKNSFEDLSNVWLQVEVSDRFSSIAEKSCYSHL